MSRGARARTRTRPRRRVGGGSEQGAWHIGRPAGPGRDGESAETGWRNHSAGGRVGRASRSGQPRVANTCCAANAAAGSTARRRTPVEVPAEVEVELEHAAVKRRAEAALVRVLPLLVDDLECNVLVRRAGAEDDGRDLGLDLVAHDLVRRRDLRVEQVRVEDAARGGDAGWVRVRPCMQATRRRDEGRRT